MTNERTRIVKLGRWIRAVLAATVVAGLGTAASWASVTAEATLQLTAFAGVPPNAVSDLTVSRGTANGQVRLQWTAPASPVGGTLDSYQIRIQTFSPTDVGGSTTTWWNSGGGFLIQGLYGETPGMTVVRTVGPSGSGSDETAALAPGTVYYIAVRSADDLGTPRDFWSGVAGVSSGTAFQGSAGLTPLRINGLVMTSAGGQFTLSWHAATTATNGQPVAIDHYVVYRYDAIGSSATIATSVTGTSFTDTVGGLTYYYRVQAVAAGGTLSALSDYVDSSNQLNRYVLAPAESDTRITLPVELAKELNRESNGTSDDYEIVAIHQPQNENTATLKSYLFQVQNARTGEVVPNFSFSQPIAEVQVSYALASPVIGLRQTIPSQINQGSQAQAVAQLISLYWFNGSSFIRLGGTVLLQNQALMVSAKNVGLYEIRAVSTPSGFALTRGSPYPRVITPRGAENRRVFWFFDNPADEIVTGTIYDIRGARVRDLEVSSQSPTANSLVWDGKDSNGAVVPSGVYLYKISAGKETQTGTVVVAR